MKFRFKSDSLPPQKWGLLFFLLVGSCLLPAVVFAHQAPTTIVLMDVSPGKVTLELQLPLPELELAFGHDIIKDPESLVQRLEPQLREYLKAHIHPYVVKDNPWSVNIATMKVQKGQQVQSGPPFWELIVQVILIPPAGTNTRKFTLDYDVIIHQVMNHAAFVSMRNDWELGKAEATPVEVGIIRWDTKDNVIYPVQINLEKGSWWAGFKSMLQLGMQHIKEGTDHLLFLLVLLLPATLVVNGKRWGQFGGAKYSIIRLLKIVTAFTIGHSLTLIVGALGWLRLPIQPVEILIAFSILVSAIHAIYPLFPGKEIYVASGFGLIHGLAFASVLANLNLSAGPMAISILGFNIGIELMQLFVILLVIPWLILLSKSAYHKWVRIAGAGLSALAATGWILERVSGEANFISGLTETASQYSRWGIIFLAVLTVMTLVFRQVADKGNVDNFRSPL